MERVYDSNVSREGVGELMLEKIQQFIKRISPMLVFLSILFICLVAVAVWVLNVGNPLVSDRENIWAFRIAVVAGAFLLVVVERTIAWRKNNRD